jgi:signal transduction histidine kinase
MVREFEREELDLINKINTLINSETTLEKVFGAIIDGMVNIFGYYSSGAYLLNPVKTHLIVKDYFIENKVARGIERLVGNKMKGYRIPLFEGSILKKSIDNREPIIITKQSEIKKLIEHHTTNPNLRKLAGPISRLSKLKSGVGIPLVADDEVVGMFGISSKERNLTKEDVQRLKSFGVQAGLAIKKANTYEELESYSKDLEKKVEEKTQKLKFAQGRLIESEKLASLGKLSAGVAHEINNPLGNISLSAELILKREKDPYKINKLEAILDQVEATSEIVKNLLAYSRKSELELTKVNLNMLIDRAIKLSKPNFFLPKIELKTNLSTDIPTINGDSKKLQQVFINLISNSLQAMPKGGTLVISSYYKGSQVITEFSDSGTGIPEDIRDKVFDPFFTTKELSTNAGLGLSVCKGIVDEHKGSIQIKEDDDKGATIVIKLPIDGG